MSPNSAESKTAESNSSDSNNSAESNSTLGGSRSVETMNAYPVMNEQEHSGTDTDTSSDDGHETLDVLDLSQAAQAEATEHVYWQYRRATRTW